MKNLLCTILFIGLALSQSIHGMHSEKPKKQTIKVALLLDTSNSMDGLINQAKTQLWDIVNELALAKYGIQKPNLQIALYEYGNDRLESADGYIRQVLPFNSDLDEISEKLFALKTNGGKEYCGQVIETSLKDLNWGKNKNDLRLIFIAGNEPFTQGKVSYVEAISDAKEKDILINTIFCGNYNQGISGKWKDGALLGGGDYMTIDQNKQLVHIITPYDNDIIILNKKLNKTYIYYGKSGQQKHQAQHIQDNNAYEVNEAVAVKRAMTKSKRFYNNSSWDLVDRYEKGNLKFSEIERKYLAKEHQKLSDIELKKLIESKREERKKIKEEINKLEAKRNIYVATKQKKDGKENDLNNAMIKAIKRQAKLKNYSW